MVAKADGNSRLAAGILDCYLLSLNGMSTTSETYAWRQLPIANNVSSNLVTKLQVIRKRDTTLRRLSKQLHPLQRCCSHPIVHLQRLRLAFTHVVEHPSHRCIVAEGAVRWQFRQSQIRKHDADWAYGIPEAGLWLQSKRIGVRRYLPG
jgi:hypothetical protein